jgi:hypothetical protein
MLQAWFEKHDSFLRPLKKKGFKEKSGTTIGCTTLANPTTLESNKSLRRLKGCGMKYLVVLLLALLLLVASPAVAQSERHREAIRLSRKLWRVIDITREYAPQFQAHVILEAPDRERLTLTFRTERAQTLMRDDVIALSLQGTIPPDIQETAFGDYLLPTSVRFGKSLWWKEWVKHEGKQIKRDWHLFLEQRRGGEIKI